MLARWTIAGCLGLMGLAGTAKGAWQGVPAEAGGLIGTLIQDDEGTKGSQREPRGDGSDVRVVLERIKLQFLVDGRRDVVEKELQRVWVALMNPEATPLEDSTRLSLQAQVRADWAETLAWGGDPAAALASIDPGVEDPSAFDGLSSTARTALMVDPVIVDLRRRLEAKVERQEDVAGITELVLQSIDREGGYARSPSSIQRLGQSAMPALSALVLERPDMMPERVDLDLLQVMISIDPSAAAEFVKTHLEAGGVLWKRRVLMALQQSRLLVDRDGWVWSGGYPTPYRYPVWIEVLGQLSQQPETAADAIRLAGTVVRAGGITESLSKGMVAALLSGDSVRTEAVLSTLDASLRLPGCEGILATGAEHRAEHVRIFCTKKLLDYPDPTPLFPRAEDPSDQVRALVPLALARRGVSVPDLNRDGSYSSNMPTDTLILDPNLPDGSLEVLARLARDSSVQVRRNAAASIVGLGVPIPEVALYRSIASDEDLEVRLSLASGFDAMPEDLRIQVMAELASDTSPRVIEAVDRALDTLQWSGGGVELLGLLRARMEHPGLSLEETSPGRIRMACHGLAEGTAAEGVVELALELGSKAMIQALASRPNVTRSTPEWRPAWFPRVSPDLYARYFTEVWDIQRDVAELMVKEARDSGGAAMASGFLSVFRDGSLPQAQRLMAAVPVLQLGDPNHLDGVIDLWLRVQKDSSLQATSAARLLMRGLPSSKRSVLVARALQREDVDDELALYAAWLMAPGTDSDSRSVVQSLISRFDLGNERARETLEKVIDYMAMEPALLDREFLHRAGRLPAFRWEVLHAIQALGDPQELTYLEELIRAPGMGSSTYGVALETLESFSGVVDGGLWLTAAAHAPNEELRTRALKAFEALEEIREAQERIEQRTSSLGTREEAIAELVVMLDEGDEHTQAEAIRGLATLEVVEAIPRLIRLLTHESEIVRKAARLGLDTLHNRK